MGLSYDLSKIPTAPRRLTLQETTTKRRARRAKRARRRCRRAATTSCTSSPFSGKSSLPSSRPQVCHSVSQSTCASITFGDLILFPSRRYQIGIPKPWRIRFTPCRNTGPGLKFICSQCSNNKNQATPIVKSSSVPQRSKGGFKCHPEFQALLLDPLQSSGTSRYMYLTKS